MRYQHRPGYRRVGRLLAQWRGDAGLTQRALAKKLKVSPSVVAKAETGAKGVDVMEFVAWCRACGVDPCAGMAQLVA